MLITAVKPQKCYRQRIRDFGELLPSGVRLKRQRMKKPPAVGRGFFKMADFGLKTSIQVCLAAFEAEVLVVNVQVEVIAVDEHHFAADLVAIGVLHDQVA